MRGQAILITAALTIGSAYAQNAETTSGNFWHSMCNSGEAGYMACVNYVTGVLYGAQVAEQSHKQEEPIFCIPKSVNSNQLTDIFRKYLTDHPEQRHMHSASIVVMSANQQFPCKP